MTSLTTRFGVKWLVTELLGKVAFLHNGVAVVFSCHDRHYHLIQSGKSILVRKHASEILEIASEAILDAHASVYQPNW